MSEIRQLVPKDLSLMRGLNAMFSAAFEDPANYAAAPPPDVYLTDLLGRSDTIVLAAIEHGEVIAGLTAYQLHKFEQQRSEIYIYDLATIAAHRRRGLARALIHHLQAIADARGAYAVFVQADYGDDPAIALYQSAGTREEVLHFDIATALSDKPAKLR